MSKFPTSKELDVPVVLFRAFREPDTNVAFVQTLEQYARTWAKYKAGMARRDDSGNYDTIENHRFIMRNARLDIKTGDYVSKEGRYFLIKSVLPLGLRDEFISVDTTERQMEDSTDTSGINWGTAPEPISETIVDGEKLI